MSSQNSTPPPPPPTLIPRTAEESSRRQRKQLTVYLAGVSFTLFSALIARRAVTRRINWARPTYFRHNNMHPETPIDGGLEALEAMSVATVNVFSWSILLAGGMMWATDTASVQEVRDRLRVRLGVSEEEQKGGQEVVGEWIEAAKVWKSGRGKGGEDGSEESSSNDKPGS